MNILLLNPPFLQEYGKFSREQRSPAVTKSGTFYYPMWLCYGAAVLEQAGHKCCIIDGPASRKSFSEIFNEIKNNTFDIVVIDTSTPSIVNDCQIALKLKDHFNSFIVLVGPHPSALPENSLKLCPGADAVAIGEYEMTLNDLANCFEKKAGPTLEDLKNIDGLSFVGMSFHPFI